ncbi:MAG: hypothetical protein L0I41_07265, partial [Leuconostoc sp.]|nr:hypothetical protein [Leuconostoc sp.]MDN6084284.1 hypothetical protein [Lactococcus plantarum]MDN6716992.1 hypothetical protein [Lactococcus lactis]
MDGTKDFKPISVGNNTPNQNAGVIYFAQHRKISDLFKAGDNITISYDIEFLNTELYSDSENVFSAIQLFGGSWGQLSEVKVKYVGGKFYTKDSYKSSSYVENPAHKLTVSRTIKLTQDFINANETIESIHLLYNSVPIGATVKVTDLKLEQGSTATPWMPSFSEVVKSDYPSYIGTYTDNGSNTQSTDPLKYTWKKIE